MEQMLCIKTHMVRAVKVNNNTPAYYNYMRWKSITFCECSHRLDLSIKTTDSLAKIVFNKIQWEQIWGRNLHSNKKLHRITMLRLFRLSVPTILCTLFRFVFGTVGHFHQCETHTIPYNRRAKLAWRNWACAMLACECDIAQK